MLQFSKSSWHYKLVSYLVPTSYFNPRLTLCKYFWTVVGCILFAPIAGGCILLYYLIEFLQKHIHINIHKPKIEIWEPEISGEAALAFLVTMLVGTLAVSAAMHWWGLFWGILYGLGFIGLMIGLSVGASLLYDHIADYYKTKQWDAYVARGYQDKPRKIRERKSNIIWEFLKAKKHKVCPYIGWND